GPSAQSTKDLDGLPANGATDRLQGKFDHVASISGHWHQAGHRSLKANGSAVAARIRAAAQGSVRLINCNSVSVPGLLAPGTPCTGLMTALLKRVDRTRGNSAFQVECVAGLPKSETTG